MAVVSDILICNMALSHLGPTTGSIESFSERSVAARECSRWYDQARREVLEAHDWSFARRRLALAVHADAAPVPWAYRYQRPADCLAERRIWNPAGDDADAIPFDIIANSDGTEPTIVTDEEDAELIYTRDVSSVLVFSPLFVNALARYLAGKLARPLTGKKDIVEEQMQQFQAAMRTASASDANKGIAAEPRDADWIRARL